MDNLGWKWMKWTGNSLRNHYPQLLINLFADVVEVFLAFEQNELVVHVLGVFQFLFNGFATVFDDEVLVAVNRG